MGGGDEHLDSTCPTCSLQPRPFSLEVSTRSPGVLEGFPRTPFSLVINMGFPDNAGGSGGGAAGVPMAVGHTWLFRTPAAVTKEISPAVSMSS